MKNKSILLTILLILVLALLGPAAAQEVQKPQESQQGQEKRKPVKIEGMAVLPLRVLARPFSNVYQEKDPAKGAVLENVMAFRPFYVYAKPTPEEREMDQGWYEVGTDNRGTVVGWMKADDVFEWKQTMCLAYTHPQGRKPVLMFESKKDLVEMVKAPDQERQDKASGFYQAIESRQVPENFPVKSVEPKKAVDISEEFYLLPILDFEILELEGREGRLLRLAAVTGAVADAREKTDIRVNKDDLDTAVEGELEVPEEVLKKLAVDVVFVMDTTVSMRPFIASTLEVIKKVAQNITSDPETAKGIKFGIWGYRDCVDDIPGIGYTTKNYTPELQGVDDFLATLSGVKVTEIDSVDFPEDVFSGVDDGLQKTQWTDKAVRIMVLAGDAPGHASGHKWNLSLQNEETLRSFADDSGVSIMALHVKNPKVPSHNELAQTQFQILANNPGDAKVYVPVKADDTQPYVDAADQLTESINTMVSLAKKGQVDPDLATLAPEPAPQPEEKPAADTSGGGGAVSGEIAQAGGEPSVETKINRMLRAALVRWIGTQTGAKAPRDIVAWAVDKDLMDPTIQSLEVRLLVNKRQLDSLKTVLGDVMAAGRRGQIGGEDFFAALQATAATAARDPNQIKNAQTMAQTGLIPEFLLNLPYKSQLMDMSNELWTSWSMDEQDQFLDQLDAKIKAYQALHDDPSLWVELNQGDEPDDNVYPVSLDLLP